MISNGWSGRKYSEIGAQILVEAFLGRELGRMLPALTLGK